MRTITEFCYIAFITDVHSRKIVGWAVAASLHTAGLPLLALEHVLISTGASQLQGPLRLEDHRVHHHGPGHPRGCEPHPQPHRGQRRGLIDVSRGTRDRRSGGQIQA